MALLPYVEQNGIYNSYNCSVPWDAVENRTLRTTRVGLFLRPEDPKDGPPLTRFLAVVAPKTPFPGSRNLTFGDITDGMATTIAFGEVAESDISWAEPRDLRSDEMVYRINGPSRKRGFGSPYGGTRVLMMNGMVRVLKDQTPPEVLRALTTAAGGEVIEGEDPDWRLVEPERR